MPLTDTSVRASKPKERPYKLSDGQGLHLLINPNGSRLWRLKYRVAGKEKLLSIGAYPAVSIKMAREARDKAKTLLATGGDPSNVKRASKRAAQETALHAFRVIADEYVAKLRRENRAGVTVDKVLWLLGIANEAFGDRPIRDITAPEILDVLRTVEARGHHETAKRLRSKIGAVFRYGVATARADNDPTFALKGALTRPSVKPRPAITEKGAFGALLRAIDGFEGQPTTGAALKLLAILAPRPGELRLARWREFNLEIAVWMIPAPRMKMRREHRVPLPRQAVAILRTLHALTGRGEFVFPSIRTAARPISENTLNAALRRMGYTQDEVTAHGFRATFSTIANESGKWNADAIERALAHVENNNVRRAYMRAEFWEERVAMAQWWADLLDNLRAGSSLE
jgi:integrase